MYYGEGSKMTFMGFIIKKPFVYVTVLRGSSALVVPQGLGASDQAEILDTTNN